MRECSPFRHPRGDARARALALLAIAILVAPAGAADSTATIGLGTYDTKPRAGLLGSDAVPFAADFVAGDALGKAIPTNQWYSTVAVEAQSHPIHALPMTYRALASGFEIGLPTRLLHVVDKIQREVRYPHVAAVVVSPMAFVPRDARLSGHSDWLAQISMASAAGESLKATVLHGSPFSYFECSSGDVRFRLAGNPEFQADPTATGTDGRVAAFNVAGHAYAIFGPTGSRWERPQPNELVLRLPSQSRYFSVAGLPDSSAATLAEFLAVAYAFPIDTRVDWRYDEATSKVTSTFTVSTVAREGTNLTTFMGLYPHQWNSVRPAPESHLQYDSVRGAIRLVAANSFTLERTYNGIVPYWGGLEDAAHKDAVDSLLGGDAAKADQLFIKYGRGTYWIGVAMGATAELMNVAEVQGRSKMAGTLLASLKARLEAWFDGRHNTYFMQDGRVGTFLGFPKEFASVEHMNDHHFHYGYWLVSAANVALRDPDWISQEKWGGMVGRIASDIATDERGRADFPFLRNFDVYESHSWASGDGAFEDGNNQESSSEATHAWAGLILLGEATGNTRMRDLGVYMYTSEQAAVLQYWFDINHQVLAPEYGKPFASMVFGGKYAYNTWWTEEPRQILGINELPMTPFSLYLGQDPAYVRNLFAALPAEVKTYLDRGITDDTPPDIWQDVLAEFQALGDPDAALATWRKGGSVNNGETRSHTLYWLLSLKEMGLPDFTVTANTTLYQVFRDRAGRRTYLAYNARGAPIHVTFSDGKQLDVAARSLARSH